MSLHNGVRGFKKHPLLVLLLFAGVAAAQTPSGPGKIVQPPLDTYNYILGTQNIGTLYQFTDQPLLIEGADQILAMGSNSIKINMGPGLKPNYYAKEKNSTIKSLTDLAQQKAFAKLFAMPFSRYFVWTAAFSTQKRITPWHGAIKPDVLAAEYKEIYDFTKYLLTTYNDTGKTFFLGNWEGDWMLLQGLPGFNDSATKWKFDAPPDAVQGMIDWGVTRQRAVDDAKRDTPHTNVQVYYYIEANLVQKSIKEGRVSVSSAVLPAVNPDFVSYSSYDSTNPDKDLNRDLPAALDFMQSRLKPKPGLPDKRVFIGEYGAPAHAFTPEKQAQRVCEVSAAAIKWGTPYVIYWELYNNELTSDKQQTGFWLIDDKNVKQPAYYTFQHYYADAKTYVAEFTSRNKRQPSDKEFQSYAYTWLTTKR